MRAASKQKRVKRYNFLPAGGVCTTHEPWLLPKNKLAEAWNVMLITSLDDQGLIVKASSRPGTRRISSQRLPNDEQVRFHLRYGGIDYIGSDSNIYYLDSNGAPVLIGAVAQAPFLIGYRGLIEVLDGGLLKAADPENSHQYGILYDVDGYLWNWLGEEINDSWNLNSGGTTRVGLKAMTPSWEPTSNIPVNKVKAYLSKKGSPTGNYYFRAYADDGTTLLGSASFDASELPEEPLQVTAELEPTGPGLNVGPDTWRFYVVEYSGGDASNAVKLHYQNNINGGSFVSWNGSQWITNNAINPIMSVGPGLPPDLCLVAGRKNERLVVGSADSKAHYCDNNDPYSWGAKEYKGGAAGWIGIGRHEGGGVNAVVSMFDDLFFSKSKDQALYRLTGKTPGLDGDWDIPKITEHEGALAGLTMCAVGDNILYLDEEILGIEGIEGFGDVRRFPRSRDISDIIQAHKSADAFAVYNRTHDQYWLHLPDLEYTLIYHILPRAWTMYRWAGLVPTSFSHFDGQTFIGSGGHLYVMDDAVQGRDGYVDDNDAGQPFESEAWGPMLDLGAAERNKEFKSLAFQISAQLGGVLDVMFRTDFGKVCRSELTRRFLIPLDDDLKVGDFKDKTFTVGDAIYPVGGTGNRLNTHPLAFHASSNCQLGVKLDPGGSPIRLGPVILTYAIL